MNKISISALMIAVAVMTTACKKDDNPATGPAQEAGAAIDNAGAEVKQETKEAAATLEQSTERAAENVDQAAERAGDKLEQAGAEVRQETREAGAEIRQETREAGAEIREAGRDVKQGAANATAATGKGIERVGEKMQDAAK